MYQVELWLVDTYCWVLSPPLGINKYPFNDEKKQPAYAQSDIQTTKYRNMVIDLGDGLKTNARLNLPANGDGPFPGVLLVPGSGALDMNETIGAVSTDNR